MSQNHSSPPQDDFARALLRSAEGDEPSNAAYGKVAAALGVSTAVGLGASLPAPAALVAGSSGLARWSGSLGGKLALLGVSGALLVGAGGALLRHRLAGTGARSAVARVAGAAPVAAALVKPAEPGASVALSAAHGAAAFVPTPNTPNAALGLSTAAGLNGVSAVNAGAAPGDAPTNDALPAAADAQAAAPPARAATRTAFVSSSAARSSGRSSFSPTSSLPEQVHSLDRARVALNSGDAGAALVEIAHYRKAWPKGVFLTEASVLEIEALAKRGERSLAATRAQAFVSAHPDSPQAERLRGLIPAPPAEQP